MYTPRPRQQEVLAYRSGKMGVSAVPGSGKTQTLSWLAAEIIARGELEEGQEVLVVTLVNSAVDNFSQRIGEYTSQRLRFPYLSYRVRTLHGLAHDIVRERPELAGLQNDFQIIDERAAEAIIQDSAQAWLRSNPYTLDDYLDHSQEESKLDWARRQHLPELINDIALSFIRSAKDYQVSPEALRTRLDELGMPLPLAQMGCAIYADYQRALLYRGAVDFDDLIRLALQVLQEHADYLARLRRRWPYILEDEAQDSSRLQEQILALLVGEQGNWVRVGDPNQAIYETFTTANPKYLLDFLARDEVVSRELPNSGRSTRSIIWLANTLIDWTVKEHPLPAARHALKTPHIRPTPRGDPQPNPRDDPDKVKLVTNKYTPQEEVRAVASSLKKWLEQHPEGTVAVLAPRNQRGFEVVSELKRLDVPHEEILRSTASTRLAADILGKILVYLSDPQSAHKLAEAYKAWRRADVQDEKTRTFLNRMAELLRKCHQVEDYVWPRLEHDYLASLAEQIEAVDLDHPAGQPEWQVELIGFRQVVQRWHGTTALPIDQVILALAQELFSEPSDLAIAHKLAVLLRQVSQDHQDWRLPEMSDELGVIARNERRFLGFSEDDRAFDPDRYKGKAVVATIHKAKGMEWDRVYLMSVNNYDFPSGMGRGQYIAEKWFIRDHLNLEAEALEQLESTLSTDPYAWYEEGQATQQARLGYISERLRLLFVGITRAKKELVMTWNTGRDGSQQQALPFVALQTLWEEHMAKRAARKRRRRKTG